MANSEIDKQELYGDFRDGEKWRTRLSRKLAHKSLDIADADDMDIEVDRSNRSISGIGWKELAVLAAAGLGGFALWSHEKTPAATPPPAVQQQSPADTEYDVRFYDKNGDLIDIPHISQRPKD